MISSPQTQTNKREDKMIVSDYVRACTPPSKTTASISGVVQTLLSSSARDDEPKLFTERIIIIERPHRVKSACQGPSQSRDGRHQQKNHDGWHHSSAAPPLLGWDMIFREGPDSDKVHDCRFREQKGVLTYDYHIIRLVCRCLWARNHQMYVKDY